MKADALINTLRDLIRANKLRDRHGEDTAGVLMKCGAFRHVDVAELAKAIDCPHVDGDDVWTTAEGLRIPIREMGDRHLVNAIAYLDRTLPELREKAEQAAWDCASMARGEMASYYADSDLDRVTSMSDREFAEAQWPMLPALEAEAERRGLDFTSVGE